MGWYICPNTRTRIEEAMGLIRIQPSCRIEAGNIRIFESVVDVIDRDIFLIPETEIVSVLNITTWTANISEISHLNTTDGFTMDPLLLPVVEAPPPPPHTPGLLFEIWHYGVIILAVNLILLCIIYVACAKCRGKSTTMDMMRITPRYVAGPHERVEIQLEAHKPGRSYASEENPFEAVTRG